MPDREWLELVVVSRKSVATNIDELTLEAVDGRPLPSWAPGAHVDVRCGSLVRQYSLCGDVAASKQWRIAVLRQSAGRGGSDWVHANGNTGSFLQVSKPRNNFTLRTAEEYVFLAGGIGITPLLPMIVSVDRKGLPWTLHYGARSTAHMAYAETLGSYGDRVHFYFEDRQGRPPIAALLADCEPSTAVYACGPKAMLDTVESAAQLRGGLRVYREFFSNEGQVNGAEDREIKVMLAASGRDLTVRSDETVLSALRRENVEVISSCHEGTCGTCETVVLDGTPDHRDSVLDAEERGRNDCMMVCVSRALSDHLVLDL